MSNSSANTKKKNEGLYSAPRQSSDHKYFKELHTKIGISEQSIRELFWLINAPTCLTAFLQVISNLKVAIEWLISTREYGPHQIEAPFYDWILFADYIEENRRSIQSDLDDHILPNGSSKTNITSHPMRSKGMTIHPLYTSLWNIHDNPVHQETFSIIQAHITLVHIKLMRDTTSLTAYEHHAKMEPLIKSESNRAGTFKALDDICRCLRDLSLLNRQEELLEVTKPNEDIDEHFIPLTSTTSEFTEYFISLHQSTHNKFQSQMVLTFGLFFQHVFGTWTEQEGHNRRGGRRVNKINYNRHDGCIQISPTLIKVKATDIDIDDIETNYGEQDTYIERIENVNLLDIGIAEGENESGHELLLIHYKEKADVPYLSRLLAAEGQIRQSALANQLLNNRWATMTTYELAQLSELLSLELGYLTNLHKLNQHHLSRLETITMLMVMLWTGSTLERTLKLGVNDKPINHQLDIVFNTKNNEFIIRNKTLFFRTRPTASQRKKSRLNEDSIHLPDLGNCARFIKLLMKHKHISNGNMLFSRDQKKHTKSMNRFLSKLPNGNRVNIHKVSTLMFYSIFKETGGDIVLASLATCTTHPLSRTQLHYTTHQTKDVVKAYTKTAASLMQYIQSDKPGNTRHHDLTNTLNQEESYFGSRLCPTTSNVERLVTKLSSEIARPPTQRTISAIVNYHNKFTVYTSQMLAYATGIRAIKHSFIPEAQIDLESGIALISDKDGDDCYNSRLVWVPELARKQLKHYKSHRDEVLNTLHLFLPDTSAWESAPEMFLLDAHAKIIPLQPKHIMPIIEDEFPFPLNVNRRYLRTHLIEQGCPQEVVNSFMGHWARGEEPWGKFSTLSFEYIIQNLKQHIPQLLNTLGWKERTSKIQL